MATPSYFNLLPVDTVGHIVRHLSKYPRHTLWHCHFSTDTFFCMLRCGGELASITRVLFDGISSQSDNHQMPDPHPEDDAYRRLPMTTYVESKKLFEFVAFLRLRSLVLTPYFTLYLRESDTFLATCATTVVDLAMNDFYDDDRVVIAIVLKHLGPRLQSFRAIQAGNAMLENVCEHCTSLLRLELSLYGSSAATDVTLASIGNWHGIEYTLQRLTLTYRRECTEADAVLVRTCFRALRELNVLFRERHVPPDTYRRVVKYFGGIGKHNLERANLGFMPAPLLSRVRSFYPSTKFQVRVDHNSIAPQLAAVADNLAVVHFPNIPQVDVPAVSSRSAVEEAALSCTKLEEIRISPGIRELALAVLRAPLGRLRLLYLLYSDPVVLGSIVGRTSALESLFYKGRMPRAEVLNRLAAENCRLRRVHLVLRAAKPDSIADVLKAFSDCQELQQLIVDTDRLWFDGSVPDALARYSIRRTHVRIDGTVLIA